mgnify:CR=1 FL=1
MEKLEILWQSTALPHFEIGQIVMMLVGLGLLFLAIVKKFEPLLLLPIGFGALLTNIPLAGFSEAGGLLHYIYYIGVDTGVFPLLIFMGVRILFRTRWLCLTNLLQTSLQTRFVLETLLLLLTIPLVLLRLLFGIMEMGHH